MHYYLPRLLKSATARLVAVLLVATTVVFSPSGNQEQAFAADPGVSSEIDYAAEVANQGISATANLIPSSGSFTVELWFKPSNDTTMGLFSQGTSGTNRFYVQLQADQSISLYGTSGGLGSPAGVVKVGSWNHLAIVYDGAGSSMYIDGALVDESAGTVQRGSDAFYFGARYDGNLDYTGEIDQFKVWSGALTSDEIVASMHSLQGSAANASLVTHYDFNEPNGTSMIYDRVGTYDLAIAFSRVDVKSEDTVGTDTVVTFPRTYLPGVGGWKAPTGVSSANVLIVGGGGGGSRGKCSYWYGAGGGGGQAIEQTFTLTTPVQVRVGQGGLRTVSNCIYHPSEAPGESTAGQFSVFSNVTAQGGQPSVNNSRVGGTSGSGQLGASSGTGTYWSGGGGGSVSAGSDRNGGLGLTSNIPVIPDMFGAGGPGYEKGGPGEPTRALAFPLRVLGNTGTQILVEVAPIGSMEQLV